MSAHFKATGVRPVWNFALGICVAACGNTETDKRSSSTATPVECSVGAPDDTFNFALAGSKWANPDVTYSLPPDGTIGEGGINNLYSWMDSMAPRDVWMAHVDWAIQHWAKASGLTITRVADDGSPAGGTARQGDSRFGDIRIFAYPQMPGTLEYANYPCATSSNCGDVKLGSQGMYTLPTSPSEPSIFANVIMHATGHGLGLAHSDVRGTVMMSSTAWGPMAELHSDDIAGIQALYGPEGSTSTPTPDAIIGPSAPSSLVASATSTSSVRLTWVDNATDESGFKVERKLGNGSYATVAALDPNATSYVDSGLSAGKKYTYRVQSYNALGASAYSNTATVTVPRR